MSNADDEIVISSDDDRPAPSARAPAPSASMQATPSSSVGGGGAPSRPAGRSLPNSLLSQVQFDAA